MSYYDHPNSTGDLHELVTTFDASDDNDQREFTGPNLNFSNVEVSSDQFDWSLENHTGHERSSASRSRSSLASAVQLPAAEKQDHNPTSPIEGRRPFARGISTSTPTTLTRLFAIQSRISASSSRTQSYDKSPLEATISASSEKSSPLPVHLYTRGLLGGRHSDINVHAFGKTYQLHRLILDRAPFFASAFSEPWLESTAKDITLRPEEADQNINSVGFELALKRLYGSHDPKEEELEAPGLLATGCWLEMSDLIEASLTNLLRQLSPDTVSSILRLVENNYYGDHGDKILASAKNTLFRFGWEMQIKYWDGISGDTAREIIGGDGFYVNNEWDRWCLTKNLLDRRIQLAASSVQALDQLKEIISTGNRIDTLMEIRTNPTKTINLEEFGSDRTGGLWHKLYATTDVEPLLSLLEKDIHYMHLDFEQLQVIKTSRDVLGVPVVSEKTIANALWMNMELRQKVLNASTTQMELNLASFQTTAHDTPPALSEKSNPTTCHISHCENSETVSSRNNGKDAQIGRYWIPYADGHFVIGGGGKPFLKNCDSKLAWTNTCETSQLPSETKDPETLPKAPNFSCLPPFRFAVEFPNPTLLRTPGRMYSRRMFYAGSIWSLYIQKIPVSSNELKFELYLHRTTDQHSEEAAANGLTLIQRSVDERIGQLEREMILRSERRSRISNRSDFMLHDDNTMANSNTLGNNLTQSESSASNRGSGWSWNILEHPANLGSFYNAEDSTGIENDERDRKFNRALSPSISKACTLPPYTDSRPKVKTYFKIYVPSKGGRLLCLYESVPVPFSSEQSWGWKSSSFMLEDDVLLGGRADLESGNYDEDDDLNLAAPHVKNWDATEDASNDTLGRKRKARDQKLRLIVLLGHV